MDTLAAVGERAIVTASSSIAWSSVALVSSDPSGPSSYFARTFARRPVPRALIRSHDIFSVAPTTEPEAALALASTGLSALPRAALRAAASRDGAEGPDDIAQLQRQQRQQTCVR